MKVYIIAVVIDNLKYFFVELVYWYIQVGILTKL